jgi:hypothetical protein
MRFDQQSFQLAFNVVMITAVTSLTVICRLLRRDNQNLTIELSGRPPRKIIRPEPLSAAVNTRAADRVQASAAPEPAPVARPAVAQQDIRQYVAKRSRRWLDVQQSVRATAPAR